MVRFFLFFKSNPVQYNHTSHIGSQIEKEVCSHWSQAIALAIISPLPLPYMSMGKQQETKLLRKGKIRDESVAFIDIDPSNQKPPHAL